MKQKILGLYLGLAAMCASATQMDMSPFTEALIKGEAQAPLPNDRIFAGLKELIQKKTGDSGDIIIKAFRIQQFKTQANCGRVGFIIMQPSSNIALPELGGQLNICNDGQPPLRECKETPGQLYQPDHKCPNGKPAVDTHEAAEAINQALKSGGLSHQQAKAKSFNAERNGEGKAKAEK
jgi:hypothetical protein